MATIRKNQHQLTAQEWQSFISAINALHGVGAAPPAYRAFVQVHVDAMTIGGPGMMWGVHTMSSSMVGRNFLACRYFLLQLEHRLQTVDPSVSLPYWDWIADNTPPAPLSDPGDLASWSVTRNFNASDMPTAADLSPAMNQTTFTKFQRRLELGVHADVHIAIGGTMKTANSPADPIFWLHHANLDRLWAQWQTQHPTRKPPNSNETLQPAPLFNVKVSAVLNIAALGYSYS